MPASPRRATLATVAASAGVSVATVSKVLNGRGDVSPVTRSLVESLLEEHDYVSLSQRRRGDAAVPATLEVELNADLNPYSTEIVQGAVRAEADAAIVVSIRTNADRAGTWARGLAAAGRRAVIAITSELTAEQLGALSRARLPLVVIDPLNMPQTRGVVSVGSTNFAGGLVATQHLLALGHRRIAYLGGPATAACNQARLHGYRAAMEAAGAPVPPSHVREGPFHYQEGVRGGAALFDLPEAPTAIFTGCDEIALGVLEAARARGVRVPEDLSIVGFDDTQVAKMASPPLTTVRQPLREMGGVAVRTALRLAAGERVDSHHVELATELVVRGSTTAPGALSGRG
ncbi:substrate-binding domain-containing protein [Streptosporangium sp. NPDC000563]|uniref:LacI family DNA-binding transcriptional regulator n=1 Tax=unclassified Streptosporangium TaxID=2632669 RepID=UPI00331AC5C8